MTSEERHLIETQISLVDEAVDRIIREGVDCYIDSSELKSVGQAELIQGIKARTSHGQPVHSGPLRKRIRTAMIRHLRRERHRVQHQECSLPDEKQDHNVPNELAIGSRKPARGVGAMRFRYSIPVQDHHESNKSVVLDADEISLPVLPQSALLRIQAKCRGARKLLRQAAKGYREEIVAEPDLTKGLPPKIRIQQIFHAYATALAEAHAKEYLAVTARDGVDRWRETLLHSVYSEVAQTYIDVGRCFAWYPDLDVCQRHPDLEAVIEAAIDKVIEQPCPPAGVLPKWWDGASRAKKLQWFKERNGLGKQNAEVYRAVIVDRKTFYQWLGGSLKDSAKPSKKIEKLLRSGVLPKAK